MLKVTNPATEDVIAEVEHHLVENRVRCVSMLPTDGMVRGMKATDTGGPISVPVGMGTLGRVLNVIGEPVDEMGPVEHTKRLPIHRHAPKFEEVPPFANESTGENHYSWEQQDRSRFPNGDRKVRPLLEPVDYPADDAQRQGA